MNRFRTGFVTNKTDYPLNIEKAISGKPENLKIYGNSYQETVEYEEYKVMPSPDFPSEVQSIGEKINNLINVNNYIKNNSGIITNYNNETNTFIHIGKPEKEYIQFLPQKDLTDILEDGETYSLIVNNPNKLIYPQIDLFSVSGSKKYLQTWNSKVLSFKVNKSIYKNYVFKYQTGLLEYWNNQEQIIENSFMLIKGEYTEDNLPPFVRYDKDLYKIPVNISSPNKYNINDLYKHSGFSVDEEGFITVTYDNSSNTKTKYVNVYTKSLELKPSTKYSIIIEIKKVVGTGFVFFTSKYNQERTIFRGLA